MKWKEPREGETRVVTYFAFFPVTINHETRWLETVTVKEQYWVSVGWTLFGFVD